MFNRVELLLEKQRNYPHLKLPIRKKINGDEVVHLRFHFVTDNTTNAALVLQLSCSKTVDFGVQLPFLK